MLGMLFSDQEGKELDYLLRKELDELALDLNDKRIDADIRVALKERFKRIYRIYARFGSKKELARYSAIMGRR
ncbi:hypothetical protein D3C81_900910 [compost metagenome]